MPASTAGSRSRRVSRAKCSRSMVSSETLMRVEAGVDERLARLSSPMPLVVIDSGMPGRRRGRARDDLDEIGAGQRLAAGEPHLVHARGRAPAIPTSRAISVAVSSSSRGIAGQPLGRHAVRAAQRALLGDRDAQVAGDATEPIDEPRRIRAPVGRGAADGSRRTAGMPSGASP